MVSDIVLKTTSLSFCVLGIKAGAFDFSFVRHAGINGSLHLVTRVADSMRLPGEVRRELSIGLRRSGWAISGHCFYAEAQPSRSRRYGTRRDRRVRSGSPAP